MSVIQSHLPRRDSSQDQILLGVLDAVNRDPSVTQRSLSGELGIALGLTNAYLKRCVRKGLIKVSQVPAKRYAYYLTPQGFAEKSRLTATYLSFSFSFFRQARAQCDVLCAAASARGQRRLALLGGGDLADIASLVAREHDIEIVGVVQWSGESARLEADVAALGQVDGVIVTALAGSQEVFDIARAVLGVERVHVPELLRLRAPLPSSRSAVVA